MSRPLIALLTDFGTARPLRRHDEGRGARHLPRAHPRRHHSRHPAARRARRRAPAGGVATATSRPAPSSSSSSIPASGSARRGLAVETGDYRFVAPDNGVLSAVLDETPARRVVELTERKFARPTISRTFEGRDRFAPAAAWLAKGAAITHAGPLASPTPVRLAWPAGRRAARRRRRGSRAGRSLRQPHHQPRAATVVERFVRTGAIDIAIGGHAGAAAGRDLRRGRRRRAVRALRQQRPARDRGQRRQRRRATRRTAWARRVQLRRAGPVIRLPAGL